MSKLLKSILFIMTVVVTTAINAQTIAQQNLSPKQQAIIRISALTGKGDLSKLKTQLNAGLEAGLTVNQIKEALVHIYAYAGFPRSIRGLQTFMTVLDERKARGVNDVMGTAASPVKDDRSKYERGKAILDTLSGAPQTSPLIGYSAFAPQIDTFLKEHLFADIFERDVLSYAERELVTVSVLSSIGGVEPMLQSHLKICLNVGLTEEQLQAFTEVIKSTIGKEEAKTAQAVLNELLKNHSPGYKEKSSNPETDKDLIFAKGEKISNDNFTGTTWLNTLIEGDSINQTSVGSVTFEAGARTKWHSHPAGQIILALKGKGYYQEKGSPKIFLKKGDVVKCPPDRPHWHGASKDSGFIQVAITGREKGPTQWLEAVTDEEYNKD